MPKPFVVGATVFPSKSAVARKAKEILDKYPFDKPLDDEDARFVLDMLQTRHPKAIQLKTGDGISYVTTMPAEQPKSRKFKFIRIDGSWTDFSYGKCLECEETYHSRKAKQAARYEVRDQTQDYKSRHFNGKCCITWETIGPDECHVDHVPPQTFDVLFADFLKSVGISIENVKAVGVGDTQIGTVFVDRDLAAKWQQYHREHAKLRIISIRANLSLVEKVKGTYD